MPIAAPLWSNIQIDAPQRCRFLAEALTFEERIAERQSLQFMPCPDRPQRDLGDAQVLISRLYGIVQEDSNADLLGHATYLREPLPPAWLASFLRLLGALEAAPDTEKSEPVVGQLALEMLTAYQATAVLIESAKDDLANQMGRLILQSAQAWLDAEAGRQTIHEQLGLKVRVADPLSCDALLNSLRRCPAIARSIAERMNNTIRSVQEILHRYLADVALIETTWGSSGYKIAETSISHLRIALSDPHTDGRWVAYLRNQVSGTSVYYKPRDLEADKVHSSIVQLLRSRDSNLFAPPVQVLARDGYGWSRALRTRDIDTASPDEWRAYGAMAALALVLNSADLGAANVVLSETGPVAIDNELWTSGIFFRSESERLFAADKLPVALNRAFPLARAGIAPFPKFVHSRIVDVSAGATLCRQAPEMVSAFTNGFEEAFHHIAEARQQLISMSSDWECELRVLYRDTGVYQKCLDESWRASRSTFSIERSLYVAKLAGSTVLQGNEVLARAEITALEKGDIPHLTVKYDGCHVHVESGQVGIKLDVSAAQALRHSLNLLPVQSPAMWSRRVATTVENAQMNTEAGRRRVASNAIHYACCGRLSDILFTRGSRPVSPHFYGGILGLLVTIAMGGLDEHDETAPLISAGIDKYCVMLESTPCDGRLLAAASLDAYGMSLLSRLGHLDARFETLASAWTAKQHLLTKSDMLGGRAGHAIGAMAMEPFVHSGTGIGLAGRWLSAYESGSITEDGAAIGVAHGTSGRALALGRFAAASGEHWAQRACRSLMKKVEADLMDPNRGMATRQSTTSWCSGLVGVGAARIALQNLNLLEANQQMLRSVCNVIEAEGPSGIQDLCCGEFGRLDFLYFAAEHLNDDSLAARTRKQFDEIVKNMLKIPRHISGGARPSWSLFQGGIGAVYLAQRLTPNLAIPSIIALQ